VAAVRACAELCGGETRGVEVGAREFHFRPGARIPGGSYAWEIGTAGSATMLALGILPVACFAERSVAARIRGGVFQDFAPSAHHLAHVLAPLVSRMGARAEVRLVRAGYLPRGEGEIELRVEPAPGGALAALDLADPGRVREVSGIALSSHLEERQVSERMARACEERLAAAGVACRIARELDRSAQQAGASLALWAETSTGCLLGADRAGAPRRSSESIGRFVADALLEDLRAGASADRHLSDQLLLFAPLARGTTRFVAPRETEHLLTNLWLAESFGARTRRRGLRVEVEGLGLERPPPG
jgi:RNA 3'-terminal phosphate cyclase (ATP)